MGGVKIIHGIIAQCVMVLVLLNINAGVKALSILYTGISESDDLYVKILLIYSLSSLFHHHFPEAGCLLISSI